MHLTCTNMPKEKVDIALREAKQFGCRNVLALRGDPPMGKDEWEAVEGGFAHGIDLVKHIRGQYGDYFDIAVAGYPQTHTLPEEQRVLEMKYLKDKVDAGANFIFTQMFYDIEMFIDWTWNGFQKATSLAKIQVPQWFLNVLEPHRNNDEKVRELGTKLVADMCRQILKEDIGIKGLHFYTMNLEKGCRMLLEELNLVPRVETIKPLPWRQSLTPNRRTENIRPIFWANRTRSYLSRTENWDEYPNGRFGDSRSPAYGELDGYGVWIKQSREEGLKMWDSPTTVDQIRPGTLVRMNVISKQLAKLNELGFLTINSQPAVDGAKSDDRVHGWGPANGYVYQKAYLEFFVSAELLDVLIPHIERDINITYYVINKRGDLRTNTHSDGPNAVTWGVFPGKEIIQPTIVEAISFMAWKDEAYELGLQWAKYYEPESPSRKLINNIMETYYLVNVVHNDYKNPKLSSSPSSRPVRSSPPHRLQNSHSPMATHTSLQHFPNHLSAFDTPPTGGLLYLIPAILTGFNPTTILTATDACFPRILFAFALVPFDISCMYPYPRFLHQLHSTPLRFNPRGLCIQLHVSYSELTQYRDDL
ncbi:Methylenetetrahydrofolate reductase 2 [Grifola frondosa]|uniref:Methylenetetrahydrofolate reductase 2 n=1 Tax=Grifola frondosa TaxID=5627 RepID=A0A1C7MBP1_GRIFR|nr:Methylenetetrahydrofolate reductase 2 [Grifola frondosa]